MFGPTWKPPCGFGLQSTAPKFVSVATDIEALLHKQFPRQATSWVLFVALWGGFIVHILKVCCDVTVLHTFVLR